MKKMIKYLALALVSASAMADVCIQHTAFLDATGAVKSEPLCYERVKNGSGGSLAVGSIVILDLTADDGVTVTTSTSRNAVPFCVVMETIAANGIGKCQTYGREADGVLFDAFGGVDKAATAGNAIYISTTRAGYGQGINPANNPSAVGLVYPVGIWYDTASATGSVEAFIQLR